MIIENTDKVRIDYDVDGIVTYTDKEYGEEFTLNTPKSSVFRHMLTKYQEEFTTNPRYANKTWNSVLLGMKYDFVL